MKFYLRNVLIWIIAIFLVFLLASCRYDETETSHYTEKINGDSYEQVMLMVEEQMKQALILHTDFSYAFARNRKVLIDVTDPDIRLMYMDEELFVPFDFVASNFDIDVNIVQGEITVTFEENTVVLQEGKKEFELDGTSKKLLNPVIFVKERIFISAADLSQEADLGNALNISGEASENIFVVSRGEPLLVHHEISMGERLIEFSVEKYLQRHFQRNAVLPGYDVKLIHGTVEFLKGYPSVVEEGDLFPDIMVFSPNDSSARISAVNTWTEKSAFDPVEVSVKAGSEMFIFTEETVSKEGVYEIKVDIYEGEKLITRRLLYFSLLPPGQEGISSIAFVGEDGKMLYVPDYLGNTIPDYSFAGYKAGNEEIPIIPDRIVLHPKPGDDTARIQEAIDEVSALEPDSNGYRGGVLLTKGVYEVEGRLNISADGVVLRGEGKDDPENLWLDPENRDDLSSFKEKMREEQATVIIATGKNRRILINIGGSSGVQFEEGTMRRILDDYIPVGSRIIRVESTKDFHVGDRIIIQRIGNEAWINEIEMNRIPGEGINQWQPFNIEYENRVFSIDEEWITLEQPLVHSIDSRWGGGRIYRFDDPGRIRYSGIENLRAVSFWILNEDGVDDTRHADQFIRFGFAKDCWARDVVGEHFYNAQDGGGIMTERGSVNITIESCSVLVANPSFYDGPGYDHTGRTYAPTGVYVGRYAFHLNGQAGLVRDCFALYSRHAYVVGARVAGPNVFLDSVGRYSLTNSEPHHRWSTGGLYDNVSDKIAIMNRLNLGTGHGWSGAYYTAWNTKGLLAVQKPPTAQNWAIGHTGDTWEGFFEGPKGYWESLGTPVNPRSLYLQQLRDRNQ